VLSKRFKPASFSEERDRGGRWSHPWRTLTDQCKPCAGEEKSGRLDAGDASILRFLAAAEILETDLWQQYNDWRGFRIKKCPEH